ncbi:MAG: polysaccharide deacetylase family protein [Oscillospiraceae bacterium]|nr:polysaccharide deacetylase family protein [Oscillospiraceae bacterium]
MRKFLWLGALFVVVLLLFLGIHTPIAQADGDQGIDRTSLHTLITQMAERDGRAYTNVTWRTAAQAAQRAQTVADNQQATQGDIDTAYTALRSAIQRLVPLSSFENPFTDVARQGWWFSDAVRYVAANDLMRGTSTTAFMPNNSMSRAMAVTVLYRMAGEPDTTAPLPFHDVTAGQWYTNAIAWANQHHIATGVGGGHFAPHRNVTREQLVTMLYRYAQHQGYRMDIPDSVRLSAFSDAAQVSGWALDAMAWAVSGELIRGANDRIRPQGTATRAECAVMLMRLIELFEFERQPWESEPLEQHVIPWRFVTYLEPDFRAAEQTRYSPRTVGILYRRGDGWALIPTANGERWVYLRANMRYLARYVYLFDQPEGNQGAKVGPQVVTISDEQGNWAQIGTWLGLRWVYLGPETHTFPWQFLTYLEPNFRAEVQETLVPQTVNIIFRRDDGWARISTGSGNRWAYLRENRRYTGRSLYLFAYAGSNTRGPQIGPQVVTLLAQNGNWAQINTWLGLRWVYLGPGTPPGGRRIALTFDDGPSLHTERLLNALRDRNVPVTFYVLGRQVAARPDLARRMVAEGHEIACHTFSHPNLAQVSAVRMRDELTRTRNIIYQTTGAVPTTFRPPYGSFNATTRAVAAEFGYPLILWSVDTRDWETQNVSAIMSHFVGPSGVRIREGDIILMHDTMPTTIDAAIRAVDLLLAEGFTFVTVAELLGSPVSGQVYRRR